VAFGDVSPSAFSRTRATKFINFKINVGLKRTAHFERLINVGLAQATM